MTCTFFEGWREFGAAKVEFRAHSQLISGVDMLLDSEMTRV